MKAEYWQKGETLDYTAESDVINGKVVNLTTRIGIAASDIAAGETGQVYMEGVYRLAKAATAAIAMGAAVYYDAANDVITATATNNTPAGYAARTAAKEDTAVLVKLLG